MRVLLVNDWTETGGGVERYVGDVLEGLRVAGDEVRLLAADVGGASAVADTVVRSSDRAAVQALLQIVNPFAVRRARALVEEFRPDVAYVSMFEMRLSPAVVAALAPVPVVLNVAYYKPICPTGLKLLPDGSVCTTRAGRVCVDGGCLGTLHWLRDQARYALIRRAVHGAAAVVTCSEHMRRRLAGEGIRSEHAPWPTAAVANGETRSPDPRPLLVYVGRLTREKGVLELVRAFASAAPHVDGACLEILGDGPLRPALEAEIAASGVAQRISLHGWAGQEQLDAVLSRAWAVAVPSLWEEPLGLAALEAIVRGVPVVATASGGLPELVEHGCTGLLVEPGSSDELARALGDVLTGNAFPGHRVDPAAARALARRHDVTAHVDWLRRVLSDAAA